MARYCFYCNRELKAGERCTCRIAQEKWAAHHAAGDSPHAENNQSATSADTSSKPEQADGRNSGASFFSRFSRDAAGKQQNKNEKKRRKENQTYARQERKRSQSKSFRAAQAKNTVFSFGRNLLRSVTKPTAFIQDTSHASNALAISTQCIEAFLISVTLVRILTMSNLGYFLSYGNNDVQTAYTMTDRWLMVAKVFAAAIAFFFARLLITYAVLRFLGRERMRLAQMARLLTPGSIYYALFLFIGLMLASSSGFQALFLLVGAYGVRVMIDHLAIRMETAQSEDAMLRMTLLIFLLTALVFGSLIGVMLPNLSEFKVDVPGSQF